MVKMGFYGIDHFEVYFVSRSIHPSLPVSDRR